MSKVLKFHKMCVLGNDFIVIDERKGQCDWQLGEIQNLCDRRFGIGADQLLLIRASQIADVKISIYNQDGSQAKQCGNGLRAVAYLFLKENMHQESITIEVEGKHYACQRASKDTISVNLGLPILKPLTYNLAGSQLFEYGIEVDVGNPHLVLWLKANAPAFDFNTLGQTIQRQYIDGINVHCVKRLAKDKIYVQHWERGTGVTPSCGSGSIASVFAGIYLGFLTSAVKVENAVAELEVNVVDNGYVLVGSVVHVFDGEIRVIR